MRTGQTNHVNKLRTICAAGTADYTFNGTTYWTDDQLADILDENSRHVWGIQLTPVQETVGGTAYYYTYLYNLHNIEDNTSGTAYFRLYDYNGDNIGTADYTHDSDRMEIIFSDNREGSAVYLDAYQYNINKAAAEIWRRKAAVIMEHSYDVTFDGHKLARHQRLTMYLEAADFYERSSGFLSIPVVRSDITGA